MIDKKGLLSALLLLSILLFGSCSAGRNFIFIIDTSGSMQEKNLLQEVKRSVKKIMLDYKSGDRFHVISFDSATSFLFSREIKNNNDLQLVFDEIDKLEALGQWTNLVQVLDYSLGKVVELQKKDPGSRTVLVVYTDGKNDPPPVLRGKKNISFTELFNKYYLNKALKKSWYIYYVELDQPEPELAAFLKDNDTGVVISKESFSSNVNFTIDEKTDYALYIWIASGILLVLLLIYFFH
ncbi:MAG: VWA domain-containing protein, partial [Oligoflexia bacterium]|nr:VWA domain-containing protein [Oligoflexia bacterium]